MTPAKISARASINFGVLGWTSLVHDKKFWESYRPSVEAQKWEEHLSHEVVPLGDDIAIVLSDAVSRIPGTPEEWHIESREEGRIGTRPCGVRIAYRFPEEVATREGLPPLAELEKAFRQDALQLLSENYHVQGPVEAPARSFTLSMNGLPEEWRSTLDACAQKKTMAGTWTDRVTKNPTTKTQSAGIGKREVLFAAGAAIALGVVLYATLGRAENRNDPQPSRGR